MRVGTVGLTEKEAITRHGESAIESYIASFSPLEWSLTENHTELSSFAKVVVHKELNNKVTYADVVCILNGVSSVRKVG